MLKEGIQPIVRVSPNISETAGHFGHLLVCVFASYLAKSLSGRFIVRIDWSVKTRGSLHRTANETEIARRNLGFQRILHISQLCGASEVIDEYGRRLSLDGIVRPQLYRVFEKKESIKPIIYDYESVFDIPSIHFSKEKNIDYCKINEETDYTLPLIDEYTHIYLSTFPKKYLLYLEKLCEENRELPRRYHKAYCHMKMDELLGVTHVVRGNDFHSNRIRDIHENLFAKQWKVNLPNLIRVPTLMYDGEKVSASEEDGIIGLFPRNECDLNNMLHGILTESAFNKIKPNLDIDWFRSLLNSKHALLDSSIWRSNIINLQDICVKHSNE